MGGGGGPSLFSCLWCGCFLLPPLFCVDFFFFKCGGGGGGGGPRRHMHVLLYLATLASLLPLPGLAGCLAAWPARWLVAGWLLGWLAGSLAGGCLAGSLPDWLAG